MLGQLAQLRSVFGAETSLAVVFIILSAAAVFVFCLGLASTAINVTSPLRRRLAQVGQQDMPATSLAANIAEFIRPYARHLLPRKDAERSRVARALVHAGYRSPNAMPVFYAVKALLLVVLPASVFLFSPMVPKLSGDVVIMAAVMAALLGFLMPSIWLDHRVKRRQRELRIGFPDAMDLLVVCVEAGLGLAPALQRVADDLMISYPELGTELALVNAEMRAGVERSQALKNLAERTGLEDIRGLVALLVQTMRFGTGIADALRVYSEEFRDKRMQAAEEAAAKMGTKMIFPLVLCLFPSFFLISIGPAALQLMAAFQTMHQ